MKDCCVNFMHHRNRDGSSSGKHAFNSHNVFDTRTTNKKNDSQKN